MEFFTYQSDNILIKVDKEGSIAYFTVQNREKPVSEENLNNLIEKTGIIYGFENAKKIRNTGDDFIILAVADKIEKKQKILYKIELPVLKEITIDSTATLPFVDKGAIIAEKSENFSTAKAKNIFGKPINDVENTDLSEIIGRGIIVGKTKIIAAISGYLYKDENAKINVANEIIVKEKIERREIKLKVKLVSESDVIESKIYSTQDVIIKGKIRESSQILSEKSVEFSSIENSKVVAQESITFTGKAINSQLIAEKKIFGKNGSVVEYCELKSGKDISIYKARNESSLEICIAPVLKEKLKNSTKNKKIADVIQNEIENKFYNFDKTKVSSSIIVSNSLEENVYLRIFDKSLLNKKVRQNFSFS